MFATAFAGGLIQPELGQNDEQYVTDGVLFVTFRGWRTTLAGGPYLSMDICKRFGTNVRRNRRAQDLSQEELADRAGIARTYLSELERSGGRNPTIKVVERIASALGVSMGSLLD